MAFHIDERHEYALMIYKLNGVAVGRGGGEGEGG